MPDDTPHPGLLPARPRHPTLTCPECGKHAELRPAKSVYWNFNKGVYWTCADYPSCNCYVGCHEGTETALGTLANPATRDGRQQVHKMFDQLWVRKMKKENITKGAARTAAYFWLSGAMGIPISECHISKFTLAQCKQAMDICRPYVKPEPPSAQGRLWT